MKIAPLTAELFNADGRTEGHDKNNNNIRFSQFCEKRLIPKKSLNVS